MHRTIIPHVIDGRQALCCLPADASAHEAAVLMRERRVGAVMIVEGGRLNGIVTERDLVYRLLAQDLPPESTKLRQIMSSNLTIISPEETEHDALDKMRSAQCRHLPVMRGDELCGMVSLRDLYESVRRTLEAELKSAEALIYGEQYGNAAPPPSH